MTSNRILKGSSMTYESHKKNVIVLYENFNSSVISYASSPVK